ncbi:hypothetical protein Desaci_0670 [Desulfosporosinus acidiphilus SJ4]|uniref:Uncharacterized protein n=1 Tax=Desulfosporosinus acidiphilus (strain DSM 22704 / JCM 16185 / SJ4) TaxID=646529 RepID=I4D1Q7_DESAJ|nr:hypothetical protein [Desulfosporosinus acidiphilus]AFM39731.1 hypothetical protein Desaci_0670 [Desulfosporosinus acidiphilus SJ4]
MLTWISMIILSIFLISCAVVIVTSCYQIFKLIRQFPGERDMAIKQRQLKISHG